MVAINSCNWQSDRSERERERGKDSAGKGAAALRGHNSQWRQGEAVIAD